MGAEPFSDELEGEPAVHGFLHRAEGPDVLALTHGASGNCNGALLVALANAFAATGISVLRFDLPFRQRRARGGPSGAGGDQQGIRRALSLLRRQWDGRIFAGGQSYGGRQASMVAASEPSLADGLLLLSYPLHPPGQHSRLRTGHFPDLRVGSLFLSGDRDPFGSIEELQAALQLIPARTQLVPVPGGAHSLLTKSNSATLPDTIVERFRTFFGAGPW